MNVFHEYSQYYDLLYQDKDYQSETQFLNSLLKSYGVVQGKILELGCGTGKHAIFLASLGYEILGIDISHEMIELSNKNKSELPSIIADRIVFQQGDIRDFRTNCRFDAVISLFHVINYQTSNEDLLSTFSTVKFHILSGKPFIFDSWYGPSVLSDKPVNRIKRIENNSFRLFRFAQPTLFPNDSLVNIDYEIIVYNKVNGTCSVINERHSIRYLFKSEVKLLLNSAGLKLLECGKWMSHLEPDLTSWSSWYSAIAQ